MAEEYKAPEAPRNLIIIEALTEGFYVTGEKYGGENRRAFSTPEGLIEWLSRELGAGPIVWALTLDIWQERVGIGEEELLPLPEPLTDPRRYQEVLEDNARLIFTRFVQKIIEEQEPKPKPKSKKKKAPKPKEEKPKEGGKKE